MSGIKIFCKNCKAEVKPKDTICTNCKKDLGEVGKHITLILEDKFEVSDTLLKQLNKKQLKILERIWNKIKASAR